MILMVALITIALSRNGLAWELMVRVAVYLT